MAKRELTDTTVQGPLPTEAPSDLSTAQAANGSTGSGGGNPDTRSAVRNGQRRLAVVVPDRAPRLTPGAAAALLRLLQVLQRDRSHK